MWSKQIAVVALLAAMAVSAQAGGRGVPIAPVENVSIETASAAAAERAIRVGASRRGWISEVVSPELVRCRLDNRGHLVVVEIPHGANTFSVRYSSSANMDYDPVSGTIHRKYNAWVANLVQDIQRTAIDMGVQPVPAAAEEPAVQAPADGGAASPEARLRKLADLREAGLITEEEYSARRREILESL
jgi:hypothetical protein